jgi:hypothetical protein
MGRYADFWTVTSEAMVFVARLAKLHLSKENMTSSRPNNFQKGFSLPNFRMNGFLEMKAYPAVQPALEALSATGIRLGFLSNLTKAMRKDRSSRDRRNRPPHSSGVCALLLT